jgi:hypothetical protein
MVGFRNTDIHSYAKKCEQIRNDFKKLMAVEDIKEVDSTLEKYEFFIENTYKINVYTRKIFFF